MRLLILSTSKELRLREVTYTSYTRKPSFHAARLNRNLRSQFLPCPSHGRRPLNDVAQKLQGTFPLLRTQELWKRILPKEQTPLLDYSLGGTAPRIRVYFSKENSG